MLTLYYFLLFLGFVCPTLSQIETYCTRDQFRCGDNKCIEKILVCDGFKHCENAADENQCNFDCDPLSMHKCRNSNKCIKKKYICDDSPDCPEKDDEENCPDECKENQFQCHFYKKQCIPNSLKCDGNEDCRDKTDESFETCNPNFKDRNDCKRDEFRCGQGLCIPEKLKCDFRKDCPDGSDEMNCEKRVTVCRDDEFTCSNNGQCINGNKKCDGTNDCADGSDEDGCFFFDVRECGKDEFSCGSDSIEGCITNSWVCDGSVDCTSNQKDEAHCSRECTSYEFQCKTSKKCLPNTVLCNGKFECPDGSDEKNCTDKKGGTISTKCHPYEEFDCFADGVKCINMSLVCNKRNDCSNITSSMDENPGETYQNCKNNYCSINNGNCAHNCHNLYYKKVCSCKPGFKLREDGLHCEDMNECSEQVGVCSQICHNIHGSFECDCRQGYTRKFSDPTRCESTGEKYLLFSSLNTIRELRMNHAKLSVVEEKPRNTLIIALDYDFHSKPPRIFWSELVGSVSRVMMRQTDSSQSEVLLNNAGIIESIAYDWINNLLYLVDSKMKQISVLNATSKLHTIVINTGLVNPRAIIIEPMNTSIYWTDWGANAKIERAGMNGEMREVLIDEDIAMPNGLAFDFELNTLYWGDAKLGTINSIDMSSKKRRTVFRNSSIHPFSMDVFEDIVYWSDWHYKTIMSVNKFSGRDLSPIAGTETPFSIHLQHKLKQPNRVVECKNHRCSHICLPKSRLSRAAESYTCACGIGYKLGNDSVTCVQQNITRTTTNSASTDYTETPFNNISATSINSTSLPPPTSDKLISSESQKDDILDIAAPDIQVGTIAAIVSFVIFMIFLVGLLLGFLLRRNYINRTTQTKGLDELTFLQEESMFPLTNHNETILNDEKI